MSEHLNDPTGASDIDALAESLRGLHLPEPVSAWPPSPGVSVVAALAAVLILTGWSSRARRRGNADLRSLQACHDDWRASRNTARYYRQGNRILRRRAIAIAGRDAVARLHGVSWVNWLEAQVSEPFTPAVRAVLADERYRRQPPECVAAFHRELSRWLLEHTGARASRTYHA